MDDEFFAVERIDEYRSLCISSLSRKSFLCSDVSNLGDDRGYFIYEVDERPASGGIQILAKAASLEAAFRLIDLWRNSIPALPVPRPRATYRRRKRQSNCSMGQSAVI